MMASSYIKVPAHELLRQMFCASPVGTLFNDVVRSLATKIGRSPGAITPALKRLANDGWIDYLSDGRGMLIEVLRTDQESDRSVLPESPHVEPDSAPLSDESPTVSDQVPDRSFAASPCDQVPDRSACMVLKIHDQTQEEESARSPLFERLIAHPGMSRSLAQRIANRPLGTLADFEIDFTLAQMFARSPFFFTVARWRDGQRVVAPEEPRHEPKAPTRSRSGNDAQRGRRAERSGARRRAAGQGHVDPSVYAAILAEAVPLDLADDL